MKRELVMDIRIGAKVLSEPDPDAEDDMVIDQEDESDVEMRTDAEDEHHIREMGEITDCVRNARENRELTKDVNDDGGEYENDADAETPK